MYHDLVLLGKTLSVYLVDPNWKSTVRVTASFQVEVLESTSSREDRYPRQEYLRHEVEATFFLDKDTHNSLQREVALPRSDFVAIPLFPDRLLPVDWPDRIWEAEYVVNYDQSGYAIYHRTAVPSTLPRTWLAPLLVGRLKERPKLKLVSDEAATFTLKLTERSLWEFRVRPQILAVGADWPSDLVANWRVLPEDWTTDRVEYLSAGDGRTEGVTGAESAPRRVQKCLVTARSRDSIRTLLNFFLARRGQAESFMVPWLARPGDDMPDTPHHVRCRFGESQLTFDFTTDGLANVMVTFTEVPWEASPLPSEIPVQVAPAYLYRFSYRTPGGSVYSRFTSWEKPLSRDEFGVPVTYLPDFGFEHDALHSQSDLTDAATTVESYIFDGNPLMKLLQRRMDAPLQIEIFKCDPAAPALAELRYVGEVRKPRANGARISAPTLVLGGRLEVKVPNFYKGPKCNHQFCGVGCGLDMQAIRCTGYVESQAGKVAVVVLQTNPSGLSLVADRFANGALELGDLQSFQSRHIVRSSAAIVDGGMTRVSLTLKREIIDFSPGATVAIYPECTGTRHECQNIWGNFLNFGGHPHIGERNLSLPQRDIEQPTGKK